MDFKEVARVNAKHIDALTNEGMIDLMYSQFQRFKAVNIYTNELAIWRRWIRSN